MKKIIVALMLLALPVLSNGTPSITLKKTFVEENGTITFFLYYCNTNTPNATATNVTIIDYIPFWLEYIGSAGTETQPCTITYSSDGGTSWSTKTTTPVTHIKWELLQPLAPSESGTATFKARIRRK